MTYIRAVLILHALVALTCVSLAGDPKPPNVLFIAIDDLRPELGCYGADYAQTPHLDQFAAEGTMFRNHFVQVPTCGASRYALLTGRSPAASKALQNQALYSGRTALSVKQLPQAQTLPELFRRSGYHTTLIGKIGHTADGRVFDYDGKGNGRLEMPNAWDELATPMGSWKRGWGIFFAYANGRSREDGSGHQDLMEFVVENDDDLPDGQMATTAIRKLSQLKNSDKPFFMGLGFFKPHLPFVAPKQDWDAFKNADVPPPPHPGKIESAHTHKSGEFYKYNSALQNSWPLSEADSVTARKAYLACVRYTDRLVGKVLTALKNNGLSDNTIVVIWGDHGWHLGDTAQWAKHTPFERANRSVLIVRAPGVSVPGISSDALVETIDLYPTLIDLCQPGFQQTQYPLDGVSLRPLLNGTAEDVKPASISYWKNSVSIRNKTHRLILQRDKSGKTVGTELFDIRDTPDPIQNIAEQNPKIVRELTKFSSAAQNPSN